MQNLTEQRNDCAREERVRSESELQKRLPSVRESQRQNGVHGNLSAASHAFLLLFVRYWIAKILHCILHAFCQADLRI